VVAMAAVMPAGMGGLKGTQALVTADRLEGVGMVGMPGSPLLHLVGRTPLMGVVGVE
jgi:hypothetical protein